MTERHVGGGTEDAARRRLAAGAWAAPHGRSFLSPAETSIRPCPWEWDVKRLAASLEVAGRESEFGEADRSRIVRGAVHSYRQTMRTMSHMSMLGLVSAS